MQLLQVFDLLLVLGLALRLTRLIVTDDLGLWLVRGPVSRLCFRSAGTQVFPGLGAVPQWEEIPWRAKLASGLDCPFCVGFWIGCLALGSLALAGGPGDAAEAWRWIAGAFALNWIAAHLGARMGDS